MRVLLTGVTGFVGRALRDHLEGEDVDTVTLTLGSHGKNTTWNAADLSDVKRILGQARPDYILHLAGTTLTDPPELMQRINVDYAEAVMQGVLDLGLTCPVVVFGSAAEYGNVAPQALPVTEDHPCAPTNPYGRTKLAQTRLANIFFDKGVRTIVLRPFNIIGPGMDSRFLLPSLVARIAAAARTPSKEPLSLLNPDSTRDYVDVRDVARMGWKVARNPKSVGRIVHLCTGRESSVAEMFKAVAGELGVDVAYEAKTSADAGIARSVGDTGRMLRLAGTSPAFSLEESLRDVIAAASIGTP